MSHSAEHERETAVFAVQGSDQRTTLEAGLRAVLDLISLTSGEEEHLAPIRGEGKTAARLFADLLDDLLSQIAESGLAARDLRLDGLLRREDGGFVAWGYVAVGARPYGGGLPEMVGEAVMEKDEGKGFALWATLSTPLPER